MRKRIKLSVMILLVLLVANTVFTLNMINRQKTYNEEQMNHLIERLEYNFDMVLKNLYFSVNMIEQITIYDYKEETVEEMNQVFAPIVESYEYRNVSILPDGVVEYV